MQLNKFAYSTKGEKFELLTAQELLSIFAGITNRYLQKRVGDGDDDISKKAQEEVNRLIERQKTFIDLKTSDIEDFSPHKKEGLAIIDEYDRLLLKHGIFK